MVIDERKQYILTNDKTAKKGGKAIDSDHFTQYMDIGLKLISEKPERIEIFDFKDQISQKNFRKSTSETDEFTNCFLEDAPLMSQIEKWRGVLNSHCKKVFKKIRIKKKNIKPVSSALVRLINERNALSKPSEELESKDKIEKLDEQIAKESEPVNNCSGLVDQKV